MYGSSSTTSICGGTIVTVSEDGFTPTYVTVSTSSGYPVLKFSSSTESNVGTHTITVIYALRRYTTITTSVTMTIYICQLVVPAAISAKSYSIFTTALTFSMGYFTIMPSSETSKFTLTHEATK